MYGLVGYKFDLGEDFQLEPSVMVKYTTPAPVKIDGGLRLSYQKKIWIGANYRTHDALTALVGCMYRNWLMFGYSYDYTTTNLRNYSTGTHEIMLGVRFSKPKSNTYKDEPEE
jgi:type IX secretion system PorP/SprF family membrane protein